MDRPKRKTQLKARCPWTLPNLSMFRSGEGYLYYVRPHCQLERGHEGQHEIVVGYLEFDV